MKIKDLLGTFTRNTKLISRENKNSVSRVNNSATGSLGEDIAARYFEDQGFTLVERNFLRKYGEIDLILKRDHKLVFVEVKSVTCETKPEKGTGLSRVPDGLMPEDNVHANKLERLGRIIRVYLLRFPETQDWQFDVVAVFIDETAKKAVVRRLENVLIPI